MDGLCCICAPGRRIPRRVRARCAIWCGGVSGRRSRGGSYGCMDVTLQRACLGLDAKRSRIAGDRRRLQEHDAADESVAVCCAQSPCLVMDRCQCRRRLTHRQVLNILQQHYVETLGRAFVVNLPMLLNFFYKGIAPFLDPATRDKVCRTRLLHRLRRRLTRSTDSVQCGPARVHSRGTAGRCIWWRARVRV